MRIIFFHNGILPVTEYGGTERIIFWLAKELVKLGHDVSIIASSDSKLDSIGAKLIPYAGGDFRPLIPKGTDLLHLHCPSSFTFDLPMVQTIHGNGIVGEKFHQNSIFISKSHARNHGADAFVYNGIDFDEYPYQKRVDQNYEQFLFLAKASWKVKNVKDAILACKKNKKALHIAGGRVFSFSKYILSYGIINQTKKIELLKRTDALIFPVRWHEPFGVAVIEAMAMGLPVIGSPYGSLPELITNESGLIAKNQEDLIEKVSTIKGFDRQGIREYAHSNFNSQKMAKGYLALYQRVLNGERINSKEPQTVSMIAAETLLDF